jgi:PKD repeat protein
MVTEDDKIYVSGTSGLGGPNNSSMLLARFLPDGSLDQSFSGAGYVLTDIRSDWDEAFAMDIQVDGKIVLTGNSGGLTNSGDNKIPVTRYLNDYAPFSAAFTSDDTTVCVNESIQFTDESFGTVVAWEWTFEGGSPSTSTEQNPEITYNTLGIYDVQLIVTSDEAETDTIIKEDYVTVIDIPTDIDTPAGETTLCNGSIYEYSTNPVLYAEFYNWEVSPENAGIINANDTSATFAPDEDYTGTFAIKVQA